MLYIELIYLRSFCKYLNRFPEFSYFCSNFLSKSITHCVRRRNPAAKTKKVLHAQKNNLGVDKRGEPTDRRKLHKQRFTEAAAAEAARNVWQAYNQDQPAQLDGCSCRVAGVVAAATDVAKQDGMTAGRLVI